MRLTPEQAVLYKRHHAGTKIRSIRNKWHCIRSRAKAHGIPFSITFEWYLDKYLKGCTLTGVPFAHQRTDPGRRGHASGAQLFYKCSIDRIKPGGVYSEENCHLILNGLNQLKMQQSLDKFKHDVRKHMSEILRLSLI